MIHSGFAPFLLDVDRIGLYSWGSTVLAYLLSRLEAFYAGQTRSLSGCLPLLQLGAFNLLPVLSFIYLYLTRYSFLMWQSWIYEHFLHLRPDTPVDGPVEFP